MKLVFLFTPLISFFFVIIVFLIEFGRPVLPNIRNLTLLELVAAILFFTGVMSARLFMSGKPGGPTPRTNGQKILFLTISLMVVGYMFTPI